MRRSRGEGSIYKRKKDGLWVAQYRDGSQKRYIYGKNRQSVADKLKAAMRALQAGTPVEASPEPLREYLPRWRDSVKGTVRERTWGRYEGIVRLHILPEIGDVRLKDLSPADLQDLYKRKLEEGLSPRSVQYIHVTMKKSLGQAEAWGLVFRNVADGATPSKPQKKEMRFLSPEVVRRFLKVAEGERFEVLWHLALTTGMRSGELLGLQWCDIDWKEGEVGVRRTVWKSRSYPPKSKKGYRFIRLTDEVLAKLEALSHLEEAGRFPWIFPTGRGNPITHTNLVKRSFKPLLRRAGLPDIPFHNLRHTCATLLLSRNVNPKIVQEMLGHATISITLDTYSHVLPNMQEGAVRAMEDVLGAE